MRQEPSERKRSPIQQKDPMLIELIEALERRYNQQEIADLSGVPRATYIKMRAGWQRVAYQDVVAMMALVHRRPQMSRRIEP